MKIKEDKIFLRKQIKPGRRECLASVDKKLAEKKKDKTEKIKRREKRHKQMCYGSLSSSLTTDFIQAQGHDQPISSDESLEEPLPSTSQAIEWPHVLNKVLIGPRRWLNASCRLLMTLIIDAMTISATDNLTWPPNYGAFTRAGELAIFNLIYFSVRLNNRDGIYRESMSGKRGARTSPRNSEWREDILYQDDAHLKIVRTIEIPNTDAARGSRAIFIDDLGEGLCDLEVPLESRRKQDGLRCQSSGKSKRGRRGVLVCKNLT
ncbi:hypothetical protein EVAR_68905_1 [Eumeta japonica]|uniref:Uncharacterized protein n=1 Tax=Eumeta variegata TaxID=151549 RepID=A0A4C1ZS26_EUMVA|nr:hypothetical protein EVAR_68905_1 [Eumeta japonica]